MDPVDSVQMSNFNEYRLEGKFCDAVIRAGEVEFQIHKNILCSFSPYFSVLFERCSTANRRFFDIPGLSPHMMKLIIEFVYTHSVFMTKGNVQDLMLAADMLNIMDIVRTCSDFLDRHLCPENCISIWQFTDICTSSELQQKAFHYITDHFETVIHGEEFLQLSVQELSEILGRDDLNVKMESTVYDAILRWIGHFPEKRERHIAVLLSKARLPLTSMEYVNISVMSNELVMNNSECQQIVNNVIRHMESRASGVFCNPLARPRLPNAILLATGGWSRHVPTNTIQAYDVRADSWMNLTHNLDHPRANHGMVFLGGFIYCVGGTDQEECLNNVSRLDLSTHTWKEVSPMYFSRSLLSVTVLKGSIYAMGGSKSGINLRSAERYIPETNQWSIIADMNERRSDASCTTLHETVYICGGSNGNDVLQTAECYNPESKQWTLIANMTSRRSGVGVIAFADHVYAVGGFDGNNCLNSAEAYNSWTNTWEMIPSMLMPRRNFGLEVIDEQLFVVGGNMGSAHISNVERYNFLKKEWSVACDMISREGLSCCVVSGIPNITEYVVPRDSLPIFTFDGGTLQSSNRSLLSNVKRLWRWNRRPAAMTESLQSSRSRPGRRLGQQSRNIHQLRRYQPIRQVRILCGLSRDEQVSAEAETEEISSRTLTRE